MCSKTALRWGSDMAVKKWSKEEMQALAIAEAKKQNIDPAIFLGLLEQESGWNQFAKSRANPPAQGVAQFMPATAKDEGLKDPFDPGQAIPAAATYLRKQIDQLGGSVRYGVMAYNAGAGRIKKHLAGTGKPLAKETVDYFPAITKRAAKYENHSHEYKDEKMAAFFRSPEAKQIADAAPPVLGEQNTAALTGMMVNAARTGSAYTPQQQQAPLFPPLVAPPRTPRAPTPQVPVMPMDDGSMAVPETSDEADWMASLMGKNYDARTQQVLVGSMPKVRDALSSLEAQSPLSDGFPTDLDGWLMELIDRA